MEVRIDHGYNSLEDVEQMRRTIASAFGRVPSGKSVVIAADWRRTRMMADDASDAVGKMIGSFNARIERSAILASHDSPVAVLQYLRVIRESQHANRRLFHDAGEAVAWLSELLEGAEVQRLRVFLAR